MRQSNNLKYIIVVALAMLVVLVTRIGRDVIQPSTTYTLAWGNNNYGIQSVEITDNRANKSESNYGFGRNLTIAENGYFVYMPADTGVSAKLVLDSIDEYAPYLGDIRCDFPSISPDGSYIACKYLGKIWLINTEYGGMNPLFESSSGATPGAPIAYNNIVTYPVFVDDVEYIRAVELETRALLLEIPADQSPIFNDDGTLYAVVSENETGDPLIVEVTDIRTRATTTLTMNVGGYNSAELVALDDDGTQVLLYAKDSDVLGNSLGGQIVLLSETSTHLLQSTFSNQPVRGDFSEDSRAVAWSYNNEIYATTNGLEGDVTYIGSGTYPRWQKWD